MEAIIKIEMQEITIPNHWHTAAECREQAENWKNEEMKNLIDKIMDGIWTDAKKGGASHEHDIRTSRPEHFYETFQKFMESLGYTVKKPWNASDTRFHSANWTFCW